MSEQIIIRNYEDYDQKIINGNLIFTLKRKYITEDILNETSLTSSRIQDCSIINDENIITNKKNYRAILIDIYKSMPTQKILQNTTFNFKLTNENGTKGYIWCEDILMSFQNKDSNGTMKEIINPGF